ncbi:MAG: Lrp/AsnC family transcriptional regulator [Lewinella sp.]|nr:Lrp/AsnC family transcriptional regulator [Lewinella sp.]
MKPLDEHDRRLLQLLQKNAKLTHKELAADLGLTLTPVYERIKRLEREGYIKSYVALADRQHLGLQLMAFCNVSLEEHQTAYLRRFEKDVRALPEVIACYHIAGAFDYLLQVVTENMGGYQRFVTEKLAALPHIRQVQSSFVMTEIKETTALPIKK